MHFDTPVDIPTNSQASATGSMQRGTDAFNDSMQPSLEQYTWAQQWYPVATVDGMDRTKPHAVMLLGQKLVLWWDVKGDAWRAFEDRCPHR